MSPKKRLAILLLKERLEKLTNKKVMFRENNQDPESHLEALIKEWDRLSKEITKHEEAFKEMIATKLEGKKNTEEQIFEIMEKFSIKTKKVDNIVAKIKAGGFRLQGPTPTEKVAILMSKINEATKRVVEAEFAAKTIQIPIAPHKSIKYDIKDIQEEGILDTIKSGANKLKNILSDWLKGVKDFFSAADQLEKLVD